MDTITIVDTSICTDNLGDEIIMDAVNKVVWDLFPSAYVFRVPSHEALSNRTRKFIHKSSVCFIGGTNILSSRLRRYGLWRFDPLDARFFGSTHTVCLGTGWNDYMAGPSGKTKRLLTNSLSKTLVHSARDSYTRNHLSALGLNTVTTSCPTTWALTPEVCGQIPRRRAPAVVFALSAWRPNVARDRAMVEVLRDHYAKIYFFPQMQDDYSYMQKFGWSDIMLAPPTTEGYTSFLKNEDVDFVGTRLHGGIRALQMGRRSLIIAIDNRAAEISKDTGLPVIPRGDNAALQDWIEDGASTQINLPTQAIEQWKAQFAPDRLSATTRPEKIAEPWDDDLGQMVYRSVVRRAKSIKGLTEPKVKV